MQPSVISNEQEIPKNETNLPEQNTAKQNVNIHLNPPKSKQESPSNYVKHDVRRSLVPIFENFEKDDRKDILSLSDWGPNDPSRDIDLDNIGSTLDTLGLTKSKHDLSPNLFAMSNEPKKFGENRMLPSFGSLFQNSGKQNQPERDNQPNRVNLNANLEESACIMPFTSIPQQQSSLFAPFFQNMNSSGNLLSNFANIPQPLPSINPTVQLFSRAFTLNEIPSEDEQNEDLDESKVSFKFDMSDVKSCRSLFQEDEIEPCDLFDALKNEQYDLSDYSSNESSNDNSYHFTHKEESLVPHQLNYLPPEILQEGMSQQQPAAFLNTTTFNITYESQVNRGGYPMNINGPTLTGQNTQTLDYDYFLQKQSSWEARGEDSKQKLEKENLLSPKKKSKTKRVYCNQKRVPLWASDLGEVYKLSQMQKASFDENRIFGKFEVNNLNLDEIFNLEEPKYDRPR